MKIFTVLLAVYCVGAIRVPSSWDDVRTKDFIKNKKHSVDFHRNGVNKPHFPPASPSRRNNRPYRNFDNRPPGFHSHRPPVNHFRDNDGWVPIIPKQIREKKEYYPNYHHKLPQRLKKLPHPSNGYNNLPHKNNWHKNRPSLKEEQKEEYNEEDDEEENPSYEREESENIEDEDTEQEAEDRMSNVKEEIPLESVKKHDDDDVEDSFVPMQLYTQVRKTEDDVYLPAEEAENGRLKEVVKNSKIHTVYTEEGYEDVGYDHGGQEKNSERDEGFSEMEKEIEKTKEKKYPNFVDSIPEGTELDKVKNNFMKSKNTKTMAVKEKDNGKMEMEIQSEVKVILQPNNSTNTHKYVKIFPKVVLSEKTKTKKVITTTTPPENILNTTPAPSVSTTSIPKTRRKRYVNDYPKIEIDTDFIDKINHTIGVIEDNRDEKYPYYQDQSLNANSPLRYSENLRNIPLKAEGNMAFYEESAKKVVCPEIESEINPIPDRVKNADKQESGENTENIKTPRIKQLGSKIDCLKERYFGKNPLDSPIFDEEFVGPVKPIFNFKENEIEKPVKYSSKISSEDLEAIRNIQLTTESTDEAYPEYFEEADVITEKSISDIIVESENKASEEVSKDKLGFNILTDIIGKINKDEAEKNQTEVDEMSATESNIVTLITTPNYTIDLKPKHIYDQISLLEYLPLANNSEEIPNENPTEVEVKTKNREGKSLEDEGEGNSTEANQPDSQALILRRRLRPKPKRPLYQIFDVNRFIPRRSTYHPYFEEYVPTSTVLPKYKVVSEVFYKDDIKPNEQLNVFADVINHIQNNSRIEQNDLDAKGEYSDAIAVKLNVNRNTNKVKKIKVPSKKIRIKNVAQEDSYIDAYENMNKISTTSARPTYRGRPKYKSHKTNEQVYEELLQTLKSKDSETEESQASSQYTVPEIYKTKIKRRRPSTTSTTVSSMYEKNSDDVDYEDTTVAVVGLMPPGKNRYKTIPNHKILEKNPDVDEEKIINKFIVPGMKPPPKQKILLYSDFKYKTPNHLRRRVSIPIRRRRVKREANKPAYSEFSRNRGQQEEILEKAAVADDDEDDDYVPHRPKNYHYDEKLGKIVYDNVKKEEEPEEEEEEEVYEVVTERRRNKKTTTTRKPLVYTTPKPGEGLLDFINKLKADPKYVKIEDPTTTERPVVVTTKKPATTNSNPPEFLNILASLKNNNKYKAIEDVDATTKKPKTTTTEAPEEEEEEEEDGDTAPTIIQNSPGGQNVGFDNLQIFDISDYLPKVQKYMPRTSIDYSKYKTIERPNTRHNLSSRYNSEEDLEDTNVMMEKKDEDITTTKKPARVTTTTTTEKPLPTSRRLRGRKRPTTQRTTTERVERSTQSPTTTEKIEYHHDKPKRNYLRRRPARIKIRTTTENILDEAEDDTTKIVRRRSETESSIIKEDATEASKFLQPIYVPDFIQTFDSIEENSERQSKIQSPETEEVQKNSTKADFGKPGEISPRKIADVDVFNQYDTNKKHGGNYKHINDKEKEEDSTESDEQGSEESKQNKRKLIHHKKTATDVKTKPKIVAKQELTTEKQPERLTDIVPKPVAFYTDPKLPTNVNQLKEVNVDAPELEEKMDENEEGEEENFDYYEDEVRINFGESGTEQTTKKPEFIKDPSKRLYYYAPV